MFRSIRHGLFAALAGFTVLICVCYTGLALVIAYVTEDMLIDRLMQREAVAMTEHFRLRAEIKSPNDELIRVYRGVETLPSIVRGQVAAGRTRAEIATGTGQHYHLRTLDLATQAGPQRVYLLADVRPLLVVSTLIQDVGGVLIFVALGLLALALLLAYLLSRRLVAPLQVLAHEVREGSCAFSAARRHDEIGYLAEKLGAAIADLHASLDREHAFTRDISHELRTPLTVMNNIVGQATLNPDDVAQLRAGLDDIGDTVEVLFALARAEHLADDTFDLRGGIEESLLRLLEQGAWDEQRLALDLPDRLEVVGNRHLSMLLINNCLGNAWFHGGPGSRLRLSFANGVLGVGNTIDPARTGMMQGFQHGRNLLLRIAKAMGWEISFHADATAYRVEIVPRRAR